MCLAQCAGQVKSSGDEPQVEGQGVVTMKATLWNNTRKKQRQKSLLKLWVRHTDPVLGKTGRDEDAELLTAPAEELIAALVSGLSWLQASPLPTSPCTGFPVPAAKGQHPTPGTLPGLPLRRARPVCGFPEPLLLWAPLALSSGCATGEDRGLTRQLGREGGIHPTAKMNGHENVGLGAEAETRSCAAHAV
ncbi:hypothetical protein H920_14147 [Fukomys damarensis]|uniref:Uncharacterized protein n=1 Tax=Fukomys damarensis TaxID=885580 RepID=A0A091DNQ0_FUKDA|nr:hypothetical protein H920_14147 [Fukomys damarensis]